MVEVVPTLDHHTHRPLQIEAEIEAGVIGEVQDEGTHDQDHVHTEVEILAQAAAFHRPPHHTLAETPSLDSRHQQIIQSNNS